MENLLINTAHKLNVSNLVRIGDLSYFEGPVLALFEEVDTGNFYLFDWVDRDKKSNRWLIYNVLPEDLLQYLNKEISHLALFKNRAKKSVHYIDIDNQNNSFRDYDAFELTQIPKNYLPNQNNFFDLEDCPTFEKIKTSVNKSLSRQQLEIEG